MDIKKYDKWIEITDLVRQIGGTVIISPNVLNAFGEIASSGLCNGVELSIGENDSVNINGIKLDEDAVEMLDHQINNVDEDEEDEDLSDDCTLHFSGKF
jgi:hypothetical protein